MKEGALRDEFYTGRLSGFPEKLAKTRTYMQGLIKDSQSFHLVGDICGLILFAYVSPSRDTHIMLHQHSLQNLKYYKGLKIPEWR